jgi:two-component system, NarL family, invasion response regulator UvrY
LIKLLIADDHSYLIEGVRLSLTDSNINVIHTLNINEIIDLYNTHRPDVVLCDIMFGQKIHGLDILKELIALDPEAKVIIFTQYDQDEFIINAYNLGAKAFLAKSVDSKELIAVIEAVNKGETYFASEIAIKMARYGLNNKFHNKDIHQILDDREIDVLRYLGDGFTEKEIAEKLHLHQRTVANIKVSLKDKLNITKPSSMTKLAIKHGLITSEDSK